MPLTPVLYAPPEAVTDDLITLSAAEAHHAATVMRMEIGEPVTVVDGLGIAYEGEIRTVDKKHATVAVRAVVRNFGEPFVRLTLAAGMSAGEKFDTIVEKGTEVGVSRFVPIISEKSRVKFDDDKRIASRVERLEKVALAAMKQCRRSYRPDISQPQTFREYLQESVDADLKLIFHPTDRAMPLAQCKFEGVIKRVAMLVGPESGFSPNEVGLAVDAGFRAVHLGRRILRAETAGPVAVALVMHLLGEFS
jgi:16S rRNA (uracil1498-N3)-methyltransferase